MSEQHQLYINGEWIETDASVANTSPSDTTDVIGHYAQASTAQVEAAITAANAAVLEWGASPLETRYSLLMDIGNELIARSGELGELLAREEGKTRAEGVGEVYRSGQFFHYFAAEVHRQIDDRAESVRPGIEIDTRREPVGSWPSSAPGISPWRRRSGRSPLPSPLGMLLFSSLRIWYPPAWALTEIISRQTALPAGTLTS